MVFRVKLPNEIQDASIKCGGAMGRDCEAWVLALDAMFNIGEDRSVDDEYVKCELEKLIPSFNAIEKVKREKMKVRNFSSWNRKLEEAFQNYVSAKPYELVKEVIEESIERNKNKILFHEVNACPEFWEQTRLIAGINVAIPLIKCAQSVTGWSVYQRFKHY